MDSDKARPDDVDLLR